MTSSNGIIFRFTGHCDRWIPLTKASDAELWCFLWSAPKQTVGQNKRDAGDCHRAHYDITVIAAVFHLNQTTHRHTSGKLWWISVATQYRPGPEIFTTLLYEWPV